MVINGILQIRVNIFLAHDVGLAVTGHLNLSIRTFSQGDKYVSWDILLSATRIIYIKDIHCLFKAGSFRQHIMIGDAIAEFIYSRINSGNLDQTGHAIAAVHQYKQRLILELI